MSQRKCKAGILALWLLNSVSHEGNCVNSGSTHSIRSPGASLWLDGVTLGQGTVAPAPRRGRKRDQGKIQGNTLKLAKSRASCQEQEGSSTNDSLSYLIFTEYLIPAINCDRY